ncbi:MAG: hypothetical protein ACLPXT_13390 [Terracidiphilus sp.]
MKFRIVMVILLGVILALCYLLFENGGNTQSSPSNTDNQGIKLQ